MERFELQCTHCPQRWWVTYQELQQRAVTYRGPAARSADGVEEYAVKCPTCGEVSIHSFVRKGGQVRHGGA
ncbi:MAG: hypothetical protein DYG89_23980 [Caldilinea sp. CFX5]|nr:hypothetical protein [Caldilinea sp. CFX5]